MISRADIIITHAISSTMIEAIGKRKKAVLYDPSGRFCDTHYDQIPEFILHDKVALWKRLECLLEMNQSSYKEYLDKYRYDLVDPYLDGRGLSRYRELLITPVAEEP
jgi:hypothetical protein